MPRQIDVFTKPQREELLRLRTLYHTFGYPQSLSFDEFVRTNNPSSVSSLSDAAVNLGILGRLFNEDIRNMAVGFNTEARLVLLCYALCPDYSGTDMSGRVQHLWFALATKDDSARDAFMEHFPEPFKPGHPANNLMSMGLYSVLRQNTSEFNALSAKLLQKKESKVYMAIYRCLAAIMNSDEKGMTNGLIEMLTYNYRQPQHFPFSLKFMCVPAYGLYNIWLNQYNGKPLDLNNVKEWDNEFHDFVNSSDPAAREYYDFSSSNNPELAKLFANLCPPDQFIAEAQSLKQKVRS